MTKEKRLLYWMIGITITNSIAANIVIRIQEKKLKACFHFQEKLKQTVHVFMPYVPESVVAEHLETLKFEEIVHNY